MGDFWQKEEVSYVSGIFSFKMVLYLYNVP